MYPKSIFQRFFRLFFPYYIFTFAHIQRALPALLFGRKRSFSYFIQATLFLFSENTSCTSRPIALQISRAVKYRVQYVQPLT